MTSSRTGVSQPVRDLAWDENTLVAREILRPAGLKMISGQSAKAALVPLCGFLRALRDLRSHAAPAGLRHQPHNSAPRPFHRVRKTDNTSIARKIVSSPSDAVRTSFTRLGKIESRP